MDQGLALRRRDLQSRPGPSQPVQNDLRCSRSSSQVTPLIPVRSSGLFPRIVVNHRIERKARLAGRGLVRAGGRAAEEFPKPLRFPNRGHPSRITKDIRFHGLDFPRPVPVQAPLETSRGEVRGSQVTPGEWRPAGNHGSQFLRPRSTVLPRPPGGGAEGTAGGPGRRRESAVWRAVAFTL